MFAEHGYKAVSLRSILRECGANIAAAHYHFGSKQRLLEAIFVRRCAVMNGERLRLLHARAREEGPDGRDEVGGGQPRPGPQSQVDGGARIRHDHLAPVGGEHCAGAAAGAMPPPLRPPYTYLT